MRFHLELNFVIKISGFVNKYSRLVFPFNPYLIVMSVWHCCAATKFHQTYIPGGTLALYSLLCRHANIKIIPNQHRTDEELTTYSRATIHERSFAAKTKRWLEEHAFTKNTILMLVLVGTCMVIGDGILTPAISGMPSVCSWSSCSYLFAIGSANVNSLAIYPSRLSINSYASTFFVSSLCNLPNCEGKP